PPMTELAARTTELAPPMTELAARTTELAPPMTELAPLTTEAPAREAPAVQPMRMRADPVTGQQPILDVDRPRPPAWHTLIGSSRRERVRPGIAQPVTLTVLVALGWLAAVSYGVFRLDLLWSLGAMAGGAVALALGLRGRSVIGLVPVLLGAAAWGMATGGQVPASPSDLTGDLRLVGWNTLYAVPLLITYGLVTWLDAAGSARDRVRGVLGDRRWFGAADVPDAEPRIADLEAVPSTRFFQLPSGSYPHLVTAGRRVALIRSTVWPRGAYTVTETGEVHRNGRVFAHGSEDFSRAVADVRTWAERLDSVTSAVAGFLVIQPASGRPGDKVDIDIPQTGGVRVINAEEFVAVAGDFLATEQYRLDIALTERLGEHLPIFEAQADWALSRAARSL
ncbi:MAG: molecular chaperone DnaJ, partial [Dactylosporangium sp.]|nr:molecular chaperone DnaJ [Dactylosporangium sp.]